MNKLKNFKIYIEQKIFSSKKSVNLIIYLYKY